MGKSEEAVSYFKGGLNCCQSVVLTYADEYGAGPEETLRMACGFGGGIGRLGHTCGAVTGAVMVLGLAKCVPDPRPLSAKVQTYNAVQSFVERFEALHKSTACCDLLGCEIHTPEGYAEAMERGLFQDMCPRFVEDAVDILEEML